MIAGCSAGGASVASHMLHAAGDFAAAYIGSPGSHQGWEGGSNVANDDFVSWSTLLANSMSFAKEFGCVGSVVKDVSTCLAKQSLSTLWQRSRHFRFAPSLRVNGSETYPLREIRLGRWSRTIPVIIGGQSCQACESARRALGPQVLPVSEARFERALEANGFSSVAHSKVGPANLTGWYASRIEHEGRWRTYARILGDSGHSCSEALHAEAISSTSLSHVWRYMFGFERSRELPGATHCSDQDWVFARKDAMTRSEAAMMRSMARWWSSLAAHLDPNAEPEVGAPEWSAYTVSSPTVMLIGGVSGDARMHLNSTSNTRRPECEHWKPFLGW